MNQAFKNMTNRQKFKDLTEELVWYNKIDEALAYCDYEVPTDMVQQIQAIHNHLAQNMCWMARPISTTKNYITPKSMIIFGNCGSGKTYLFEIMSKRFNCIRFVDMDQIEKQEPKRFGFWNWFQQWDECHLVLDDIGDESDKTTGAMLIRHRERLHQKNGILTFYTTNLKSKEEIEQNYGTRILSRLNGQCNFLSLIGPDRRSN